MPKYLVKSPLKHDGKSYQEKDLVDMSKEQAQALLSQGVLAETAAEEPKEKGKKKE